MSQRFRRDLITVLTPTIGGREHYCKKAIQSVERQTLKPTMHMIVMDVDRQGCAAMKNKMLSRVRTEWVAFLDDDDYLYPNHIESLMTSAALNPDKDLFYPWFDAEGWSDFIKVPRCGEMVSPLGVEFGDEQRDYLLNYDNFIPCTVLARTEALLDAGGFALDLPDDGWDRDDWSLWKRLLTKGCQFWHVPLKTWAYVRAGQNTGGYPVADNESDVVSS